MSKSVIEPPDIAQIFDKPGRLWTPGERNRVKEWLHEDPQLRYLLVFALRHLCCTGGEYVQRKDAEEQRKDAEDTWGNFYVKRLDSVINSYDPARGRRFWNYLLLCFERYCHDEGERVRKERGQKVRLEVETQGGEGEPVELEIADEDESIDPDKALERKERRRAVRECVNELPPPYRAVIVMYYFEEMSVVKSAAVLGISESNIKVRLHRARQQLAECLRREGWVP